MARPLTIAHLTDVHLGPIGGLAPRYWNAKRLLGYANWLRRRRHDYQGEVLARILADLAAQGPDHIAVTGDLVNIGLPQETIAALAWLEGLGPPERVTVVPGNHDIYSRLRADPGVRRWARYMTPDAEGAPLSAPAGAFPFVRRLGPVALIATNSAVATPPFIAWGRLGQAQLAHLGRILARLGGGKVFRLVLIHHPPLPGQTRRSRALRDAGRLQSVLTAHGAELVIHGHNHRNMLAWCTAGGACIPIVGAPSAAQGRRHGRDALARYNLYRIAGPPWTIELVGRGLAEPEGPVVELERRSLAPHAGHEGCSWKA
jgi:3',5'-cyclic AMP phosphodiesterase CpdA